MTAPTFPEVLRQLAERVPERVQAEEAPDGSWEVDVYEDFCWRAVCLTPSGQPIPSSSQTLEYALREEVEARGWWWATQGKAGRGLAFISPSHDAHHSAEADSPAHALSLALLAALTAGEQP